MAPPEPKKSGAPAARPQPRKVVPAVVGYTRRGGARAPGKPKLRWARVAGTTAIGSLALVVVVAAITLLALPGCLRRKCVDAAARSGVTLTIGDVRLGAGRFTLVDVGATSPELHGVAAQAAEVDVEMGGLEIARMTARGGTVTIDGPYERVKDAFARFRAAHAGAPTEDRGASAQAARVVLEGTHLVWTRPFGDHVRLDALELRAELGRKGPDYDVHVLSPHVVLDVEGAKLGPWRVSHDREGSEARSRLFFDPQLPDGPNASFVATGDRLTMVDVTIARTQLANVGIAPEALGLPPGAAPQIEASIHFGAPAPTRADAHATVGLYALKVAQVPTPLDAKLELSVSGDPTAGAEVKKGSLSVGPLRGAVVGVLRTFDDGMRIDLGWKAGPMACSDFVSVPSPMPQGAPPLMGDIAQQLTQLAQATGIAKVSGDVRMEGTLAFDSRDFDHTKATFSPRSNCDLSLFGQK